MTKKILVVDDDLDVRQLLERYLTEHGFDVQLAHNGPSMAHALEKHRIDLVVLDLILPGEDGIDLAKRIRERSDIPIIMVTGRSDEIDRILGLEIGADDYLPKPFSPRELLARIKSVLRRTEGSTRMASDEGTSANRANFAGWILDIGARKLSSTEGEEVDLTPGEFNLLSIFVSNRTRVLSRDQLLDHLQGNEGMAYDRSIDVQVMRLRRKIEPHPRKPALIKTIRNAGYIFSPSVDWR